jgi:hypothetical protein
VASPVLKVVVANHDTEESILKDLMNKFGLDIPLIIATVHFLALSTDLKPYEYDDEFHFASDVLASARLDNKIDWIIVFRHKPLYSGSGLEIPELRAISSSI